MTGAVSIVNRIRQFLELIRFSHTIFALPFALLAALMACRMNLTDFRSGSVFVSQSDGMHRSVADHHRAAYHEAPLTAGMLIEPAEPWFRYQDLVGVLLCMVAGRSAAMAFNRLADRQIDALNPRTAGRHLPSGKMQARDVALLAAVSSAIFVATTVLFLPNWLPLYLAVPTLGFLMGYSYAKRFTALSHFWLGSALAIAPIFAWIGIRGPVVIAHPGDLLPVLILGGAVMLWVAGFDIIYACQDAEFDRAQRLHSLPAKLGIARALRIAAACHAGTVALLSVLPFAYPYFGGIYWLGVGAIAVLLVYEHWLVRPDDLARVNTAFFNVNAVISIGLLIVGAVDLWW